jgi:phenylalanyl-tRNA synthetase beta chain
MKFTYNWLKEYVDVDIPAGELSDILTMAGLEIEALSYMGEGFDNIFTVRILEVKGHPNADKLSLCSVTDGSENYEIVCGAKNMKQGDIVALAKEGARLPNGILIKPAKIRGVVSNGMLCSETELGLADESGGIMILPADTEIGAPLMDVLGLDDYFFEIGLTPNRSDCLSLLGIAKEVSILTGAELKDVGFNLEESNESVSDVVDVSIIDTGACHRYTARVLKGITIKDSDPVIKSRLNAIGVRAINNIVDITNYVMFVYGQPLHAFDYDKINGKKIIVKYAKNGEKFTTLDEKERELIPKDLIICDGIKSVALGGVMGGMNTEVSDGTKDILLESAYFDPATIRKTSSRLGLASESSHRFERGVNPETVPTALDYAASLMQKSTGCGILKGIRDVYPVKYEERTIKVRFKRVNKILGTDFTSGEVLELLRKLRLTIKEIEREQAEVVVPKARHDLTKEIDIIEDITRAYGYNNIKVTLPKIPAVSKKKSKKDILMDKVRDVLVSNGFYEAINYSFYAPKDVELISSCKADESIRILNPLTDEQSVMRMSLIPELLETVKKNFNHKNTDLKLFELGKTFKKNSSGKIAEKYEFAGIISGYRHGEDWSHEKNKVDFFDIKGIVELVLENIKVIGYIVKSGSSKNYLHPSVSVELYIRDELLGVIGELHPGLLEGYGISEKLYVFDFDFDKLIRYAHEKAVYSKIPKYPFVKRDIALVVNKGTACDEIVKEINAHSKELIEDVTVFDLYEGSQLGEGNKSIAFRITYRDLKKTLTDDVVNETMAKLTSRLKKKFNVKIRK